MRRASGHISPMLIPGRAAIGCPTNAFRLCLVHELEKAVDGCPVLGIERAPHLKPPSKKLPGHVPVLRIKGCSRPGFEPVCGLCPAVQHLLHRQVTQEGSSLHVAAGRFEIWVACCSKALNRAFSAAMRLSRSMSLSANGEGGCGPRMASTMSACLRASSMSPARSACHSAFC